jgi:transposase-like protein
MMPMKCPKCSHSRHRVAIINSRVLDQVVRKRVCEHCGHQWFTVEAEVSRYAIGWCSEHQNKPVLRVPVTLQLGFVPCLPPGRPPLPHYEL